MLKLCDYFNITLLLSLNLLYITKYNITLQTGCMTFVGNHKFLYIHLTSYHIVKKNNHKRIKVLIS